MNEDGRVVEEAIEADFQKSQKYRILAGYSSLDYLIDWFEKNPPGPNIRVSVILGNEPQLKRERNRWTTRNIQEEIRDFWLSRGVSIIKCGAVLNLITYITEKEPRIRFSLYEGLHAKIFIGDHYAVLGSSNFSYAGLKRNKEANVRFEKSTNHYAEILRIAINYEEGASDFTDGIVKLLLELVKFVDWRDALGRAISEILEGRWMERYPEAFRMLPKMKLWPSQREAIGQALSVLDHEGSVLIADPTGSGKTRLNASLQLAAVNRQWKRLAVSNLRSLIIAPPAVQDTWKKEYQNLEYDNFQLISHGSLSQQSTESYKDAIQYLKGCTILVLDEAHNYLRSTSNRSDSLLNSYAEHIILATATPINRKAEDLLRMIELLGVDNLSDQDLKQYKDLRKKKGLLRPEDKELLKSFIGRYMVRRTKKDLNAMIDRDPEAYRNAQSKLCRYPETDHLKFETGESEQDRHLAGQIDDLCRELKGIINLETLYVKGYQKGNRELQKQVLERRLIVAAALARYQIRSRLRSSRPAAIEHIWGTRRAESEYSFKAQKKKSTGNMIAKLREMTLPKSNFDIPLPNWLSDQKEFRKACEKEAEKYEKIGNLIFEMRGNREDRKAQLLTELVSKNKLVVAFDSSLISLSYLEHLITGESAIIQTFVATASTDKGKRNIVKVKKLFRLGSNAENCVALCSDAMSEGVSLQQAQCVVLLDMPGVMRLAEQRIGRIDRMDSPHKKIFALWPNDSKEFALKKDERLIQTHETVEQFLGANIEPPSDLRIVKERSSLTADNQIQAFREYQRKGDDWVGIKDAFFPIRQLIGKDKLLSEEEYEQMKGTESLVKAKVSLVKSEAPWGFFAIKGSEVRAPRWIFFEPGAKLEVRIEKICELLEQKLANAEAHEWDQAASQQIRSFIDTVQAQEVEILPNKKKRAIIVFRKLVSFYKKQCKEFDDRKRVLQQFISILENRSEAAGNIDLDRFAKRWLEKVQPIMANLRADAKQRKVVDLWEVEKYLRKNPLPTEELQQLWEGIPWIETLDRRIAACIVGVADQ